MPDTRSLGQHVEKDAVTEGSAFNRVNRACEADLLVRKRMVVNPFGALKLLQNRPRLYADSSTSRKLFFGGRQGRPTALSAMKGLVSK